MKYIWFLAKRLNDMNVNLSIGRKNRDIGIGPNENRIRKMSIIQIKFIYLVASHTLTTHARTHSSIHLQGRLVYLLGFCWFTCNRITEDMIFDENLHGIFHIATVYVHTLQCRGNARRIHRSLKLQIVESIYFTITTTTIKIKMNERKKK